MRAVRERADIRRAESETQDQAIRMAPVFDSDRAAHALSRFLEEARGILDRVEDSYLRGQDARPLQLARRNVLRHLAGADEAVEFHHLPSLPGLGLGRGRALVQGMVEEGLLSMERNPTYPNMMYLDITSDGREELRRIGVKEAMTWMHGANSEVAEAVSNAREALVRLVEAIAA